MSVSADRIDPQTRQRHRFVIVMLIAIVLFAGGAMKFGYQTASLQDMLDAFWGYNSTNAKHVVLLDIRFPRLMAAIVAGIALGVAGVLMQVLTRNPLADPGLLGVNAGASLGVVISIMILGITDPARFIWSALGCALVVSAIVLAIGANRQASPLRLIIAGAAIMALSLAIIRAIVLLSRQTLDTYRFWVLGGFDGVQLETLLVLMPFFAIGMILAVVSGIWLNALALGSETAKGLGVSVLLVQFTTIVAIVFLCAATVSMAGPISFVGLVSAHIARLFSGADTRWMIIMSALIGALLLIAADLVGRLPILGGNMQAGLLSALIGGPVLIWLIRNKRLVQQ